MPVIVIRACIAQSSTPAHIHIYTTDFIVDHFFSLPLVRIVVAMKAKENEKNLKKALA